MRVGPISDDVIAALTRTTEVKRQVRTVANEVRKRARANARPFRDSGDLIRGLAVTNVLGERGRVEYRVGWSGRGWYGSLVELGTEDTAARPHLRPAAEAVKGS